LQHTLRGSWVANYTLAIRKHAPVNTCHSALQSHQTSAIVWAANHLDNVDIPNPLTSLS